MRAADVSTELAEWLWEQITPCYFRPLTPYASDRIYGDFRIDPDDISDIALRYEKAFGVRLVGNPIPTPADPTWAELCVAFERHGFI